MGRLWNSLSASLIQNVTKKTVFSFSFAFFYSHTQTRTHRVLVSFVFAIVLHVKHGEDFVDRWQGLARPFCQELIAHAFERRAVFVELGEEHRCRFQAR